MAVDGPRHTPPVKAVQTPHAAAIGDRVAVQTGREQLPLRDDSVLPSRQPGERDLGCGHSVGTIATK
jgi:hypothetical protein